MLPVAGKVNFVEEHRKAKVRRYRVDWHKMYEPGKAAELNAKRTGEQNMENAAVPFTLEASVHVGCDSQPEVKATVNLRNNKPVQGSGQQWKCQAEDSENNDSSEYVSIDDEGAFNLEEELK